MSTQQAVLVDAYDEHRDECLRDELRARGVRYSMAACVDMHGVNKAKAVPIDRFTSMMRGSGTVRTCGREDRGTRS